jgi:hypothetical protein
MMALRRGVPPVSRRVVPGAAGIVMAVLLAAFVPLTIASRDLHQSADGTTPVLALALAAVGIVVARRQPRNPVGWVLLGSGLATMLATDAELYAVLDYRVHHGTLPLGPAAAFWVDGLWALGFLIGTPALILFPDGHLPGRLWRWSLRAYTTTSAVWLAGQVIGAAAAIAGHQVHVDASGGITNNPAGLAGILAGASWVFAVPVPVIWLFWIGRQVLTYRRCGEQRREQLKWLTGGAVLRGPAVPQHSGGGRGHADGGGLVQPSAAARAAGGGPAVQPDPVRRGPDRGGVRGPAERCPGPGRGPR